VIEFKPINLDGTEWREQMYWRKIPPHHTHVDCLFRNAKYKIQGKVYKHFSNVFVKAFYKERIWEKLGGGA